MQFPRDHYWHWGEYNAEWLYFWGKLDNGKFFHFAENHFKIGGLRTQYIDYSIDGKVKEENESWEEEILSTSGYAFKRYSFQTPQLGLVFFPESQPVIHKTDMERRNYYSVPFLKGNGHLNGKEITAIGWFDHEFSDFRKVPDWDWVAIQLDAGIYIMAWACELEPVCDVTMNNKTVRCDFELSKDSLKVSNLGMKLEFEPIGKETIFKPKLGIHHSEQAFNVHNNGKRIGVGMRERTYRKENEDG